MNGRGIGNNLDFGERGYDSRTGRWLSNDPMFKKFPNESGYIFAGSSPIAYIDEGGNTKTIVTLTFNLQTGRAAIVTKNVAGLKGIHKWAYNGLDSWDWYDYTNYNTIVIDKNGKTSTSTSGPIINDYTDIRTNTLTGWEWWAKSKTNDDENNKVKDKSRALDGSLFEGYLWTTKSEETWVGKDSKLNPDGSSNSKMVNIDDILSAFNVASYASGTNGFHSPLFDSRYFNDVAQVANELQSNNSIKLNISAKKRPSNIHVMMSGGSFQYFEYKRNSKGNTVRRFMDSTEASERGVIKEADTVDVFGTKYKK